MKKAIIGAGGFAREIKQQILDNNPNEVVDFFVDESFLTSSLKSISQLDTTEYEVIVAIADTIARNRIISQLPDSTKFFTFIHKSAQILDKNIIIGEGSIICPNVIITTNVIIGKHCHLNLSTTIGHDCLIGDYFTTAPGAKISGNCKIGNRVYVGTNSSIREKLTICDDAIIGLNAGVVKNITESGIYAGVPAKLIKYRDSGN